MRSYRMVSFMNNNETIYYDLFVSIRINNVFNARIEKRKKSSIFCDENWKLISISFSSFAN